jgi:transcriptional regulator with XRE-family HTH domain
MEIRGDTLRQLREDRGLSQPQLAKAATTKYVHVSGSYLSQLERGQKKNPSDLVVARLAKTLGVEPFVLRFDPEAATAHLALLALFAAKGET